MAHSFPTHLTCAYCPSQSYPGFACQELHESTKAPTLIKKYTCTLGHKMWIEPEKAREPEPTVEE